MLSRVTRPARLDLIVLSVVSLLLFTYVADEVLELDSVPLDLQLQILLRTAGFPYLVANVLTWMGGWVGYVLAFLLMVRLYREKRHRELWCFALALTGAMVLSYGLKYALQVPRPYLNGVPIRPTWSFPSGHTLFGTCLYGYWGARLWSSHRGPALGLLAMAGLVGWSRLALGVHWASDVVAGWLLGVAWVGVCLLVHHRMAVK